MNEVYEKLTILLALKDRVGFTLRWMSYADRARFPFRILIADGGSDERVLQALSDRRRFPNLNYEYVRYPYDRTYTHYYAKIADALTRVETPFVAMSDNDDFFTINGLHDATGFLLNHDDYMTCGGQCAFFWTRKRLYNKVVAWKRSYDIRSTDAQKAAERLLTQSLSAADPIYYHVKRTERLRKHFEIVSLLDLKDLFLVEALLTFLAYIDGKTKRLGGLYIARQRDAPGSSGSSHVDSFGDSLGRMLVPTWSDDFIKFLDSTSRALANADDITVEAARDCILTAYRKVMAPILLENVLREPTTSMAMPIAIRLVQRLLSLRSGNPLRMLTQKIYRDIPWISFDFVNGAELFSAHDRRAKRDFDPIARFLAETHSEDQQIN